MNDGGKKVTADDYKGKDKGEYDFASHNFQEYKNL